MKGNKVDKEKILLTGGTGFLGSHTAVALLEAGYDVVLFDNLSNSDADAVACIARIAGRAPEFVQGDICDESDLEGLFSGRKFDALIHFAALKAVGESVLFPLRYYENNVLGSTRLYAAALKAGVRRVVFSSSATVYDEKNPIPYVEGYELGAANPYGRTKLINEYILRDLCCADAGLSAVSLRYFNACGAHPSGLLGENPKGIPYNLFPYIAQVASGEREKLQIFGGDYDTPDGTCIRDYIHVLDLAAGHMLALRYTEVQSGMREFNLGTGIGTSVKEIVSAYEKALGRPIPADIVGRRPGDLPAFYADVSLARKELGFVARLGVEDACIDSVHRVELCREKARMV